MTDGAMRPLGAQISAMLKARGVEVIFGLPGGSSISMYNALPLESVGVLVDVMSDLERRG